MSSITDEQLRSYIDHIFMKYDRDRSGNLSSNQLVYFFNDLFQMMNSPRRVTQWEAQQAIRQIDRNNDGQASKLQLFTAFKAILNTQPQPNYGAYQGGYKGSYGQQSGGWGNQPTYQQQGGWSGQPSNQGMGQSQGWGQNQGWGNQGQNTGYNQPPSNQGWGHPQQHNPGGWGNQQANYQKNWGSSSGW